MRRVLRCVGIALASVAASGLAAYGVLYLLSERVLRRSYEVPPVAIAVPTDPASIAEGRRLAIIRGCFGGCHGRQAEGMVMFDDRAIGRVIARNLTAATRNYSDADLAVAIRTGLRPGGQSTIVMPSAAFVGLTDEDLGRIIAFLKSLPPVEGPGPMRELGPLGRVGLATGRFKLAAQRIAATVPPPGAAIEEAAFGRYLARTSCAQCHETSLRGDSFPDFTSPSLQVVAAYPADDFARLMRTGVATGGRELETMGERARAYLSQLTDSGIGALYSYLHELK